MQSMHFMIILWIECEIYCSKTFSLRWTSTRKLSRHGLNQKMLAYLWDSITLLSMRRRLLALRRNSMLLSILKRFSKPTINLFMNSLNQHTLIAWQQLRSRASSMSTTRRGKSWLTVWRQAEVVELRKKLVVVYIRWQQHKHYIEIFL